MGPLFKKGNSTYARFTFSGSDLVPLLRPEGAQKFLKREKNSICDCILRVTYLSHVCGIYIHTLCGCEWCGALAPQPMVDTQSNKTMYSFAKYLLNQSNPLRTSSHAGDVPVPCVWS